MPSWVFSVCDDPDRPELRRGYVRASVITDAFALIDDPATNLYPLPGNFIWPDPARDVIDDPLPSK